MVQDACNGESGQQPQHNAVSDISHQTSLETISRKANAQTTLPCERCPDRRWSYS